MDFPIHIDTISMDLSILYFKGTQVKNLIFFIFLSLKIVNNQYPDEMLHYTAFHLVLHCLPKYLFIGIQNEKG